MLVSAESVAFPTMILGLLLFGGWPSVDLVLPAKKLASQSFHPKTVPVAVAVDE